MAGDFIILEEGSVENWMLDEGEDYRVVLDSRVATRIINQQHVEEKNPYEFKDFIVESGLPPIKPLGKKFKDLNKFDKYHYSKSFQVFACCARTKINRLLKVGGISKRRDVSCGSLDRQVFQMMMEDFNSKFTHSSRKVERHGITYNVPCIAYRFVDKLPVLDIFENWGKQELTSITYLDAQKESQIITEYLLEVNTITFVMDTETQEVFMHFTYSTKVKFEGDSQFHFY